MSTQEAQDRRRRVLAMFARRALHGLREQRDRLDPKKLPTGQPPAPHDLDFYAHAAWQLRESARMASSRLPGVDLEQAIAELDRQIPRLASYRNVMAHAVDDKMDGWAWFGPFAAKLLPGGDVEYLVDSRHDHEALELFYQQVIVVLDPDGELDDAFGKL